MEGEKNERKARQDDVQNQLRLIGAETEEDEEQEESIRLLAGCL